MDISVYQIGGCCTINKLSVHNSNTMETMGLPDLHRSRETCQ